MSINKKRNDKIELTICRSVTKSKCIYIGSFRVYGSKPYPIGNNVLENYEIDVEQVEKALEFHKRTNKL